MTTACFDLSLTTTQLRCEYQVNPLGILVPNPRLSWIPEGTGMNRKQRAYQVIVSSSEARLAKYEGDFWNSGKIDSDESVAVVYEGAEIACSQKAFWKVRLWDERDQVGPWSEVAYWSQGLTTEDWQSEWIGYDKRNELELPVVDFGEANWIWYDDAEACDAPVVFEGFMDLPDIAVESAELRMAVAGCHQFFWCNEQYSKDLDADSEVFRPYIRSMTERLSPGRNWIRVLAWPKKGIKPGLMFSLKASLKDGSEVVTYSSNDWVVLKKPASDWWNGGNAETSSVTVVGQHGDSPWGWVKGQMNLLPPPACFRKEFSLKKPVKQVLLYATAFGFYDLSINGTPVNRSYFDPGWTDYRKRLHYRTYDVTSLLIEGGNAIAVTLADGWYAGYMGWGQQREVYGSQPRFRGEMHLTYEDGTRELVVSDGSWAASTGPTLEADLLMGESYDARRELEGWNKVGFDDSHWSPVDLGAELSPVIEPHPSEPIVALEDEVILPKSIREFSDGCYLFDLGQNFAGVVRLCIRNSYAGQRIQIRFGEWLNDDGSLYVGNLRTARATDTYICKGVGEETWSPRFTFHGFQFVEVSGLTSTPDESLITGIPLSSDTPIIGHLETNDVNLNQLSSNVYWGQRSNFLEVPMDCPQRDERLGWCDGAQTFFKAAACRADVQSFYRKWIADLNDAQSEEGFYPFLAPLVVIDEENMGPMWRGSSPAWTDAGVLCPWRHYEIYGDVELLKQWYPNMCRMVDWYAKTSGPDLLPEEGYRCLGDWLNHEAVTPHDLIRTAFFAHSSRLVAKAAVVVGDAAGEQRYLELFERVRSVFIATYIYDDGSMKGDTQAAYALALYFDLLDAPLAEKVGEKLVECVAARGYTPSTGLVATMPLMLALARTNRNDVAYKLIHNDAFPSWNFSIKNGATTIWERWNSWTPEGFGDPFMNSFNHLPLGAVYQWMMETIGGIQAIEPGYRKICVAPVPGGKVTEAKASYRSIRGDIAVEWTLEGHAFSMKFTIPVNTTAEVSLPPHQKGALELKHVSEGAVEVVVNKANNTFELGSGEYELKCVLR